ncbi:DNA polymerase III subunit gamma/tau [Selenomonadales bacterium OttesenSCG-928-I06]|nr:DNA polymerase III subunit gamma/tau [Selenomonadales bacterium OttesenSCG-928-I06]
MAYIALYRKWRPQDFESLVGQEHISTTLKNAIKANKIAHAYLFSGSRGTGKTSTAKIFAKALNCEHGPTPNPCNECSVCTQINTGSSMDVFEIDAASNRGIDEIRDLRETVKFSPADSRYKVYIIDEVHMLTTEAFNALLKTLEEPPSHVIFILATTEPHKIPATIHSRCQRHDFRRLSVKVIEDRILEIVNSSNINIDRDSLKLIAIKADGSMRDALSILDQCTNLSLDDYITLDLVKNLLGIIDYEWLNKMLESLAEKDIVKVLRTIEEVLNNGKDIRQFLLEFVLCLKHIMLYKSAPDLEYEELTSEYREMVVKASEFFSHEEFVSIIKKLSETLNEVKWSLDPRTLIEIAFISICKDKEIVDLAGFKEKINYLELEIEKLKKQQTTKPAVFKEIPKTDSVNKNIKADKKEEKVIKEEIAETVVSYEEPLIQKENDDIQVISEASAIESSLELDEIWRKVLDELISNNKRSVHACVSQGKLAVLNSKEAKIEFSVKFPKERSEKPDYKVVIEDVFKNITGNNIFVSCVLASAKNTKIKAAVSENVKSNGLEEMTKEAEKKEAFVETVEEKQEIKEDPAVARALSMFGGKIVREGMGNN